MQIITKRIYDAIEPIIGDDFVIRFGDRYNIINNKGEYLLSKNIDYIDTISVQEDCLYNIMIKTDNGNKFNFFNVNTGKFISDVWFDKMSFFENGKCKVKCKDKDYVIDVNGKNRVVSNFEIVIFVLPIEGVIRPDEEVILPGVVEDRIVNIYCLIIAVCKIGDEETVESCILKVNNLEPGLNTDKTTHLSCSSSVII